MEEGEEEGEEQEEEEEADLGFVGRHYSPEDGARHVVLHLININHKIKYILYLNKTYQYFLF